MYMWIAHVSTQIILSLACKSESVAIKAYSSIAKIIFPFHFEFPSVVVWHCRCHRCRRCRLCQHRRRSLFIARRASASTMSSSSSSSRPLNWTRSRLLGPTYGVSRRNSGETVTGCVVCAPHKRGQCEIRESLRISGLSVPVCESVCVCVNTLYHK